MEQLEDIITCFDRVFASLGQPPLLSNPEFDLDEKLCPGDFLRFSSIEKSDRLSLQIELSDSGVEFWIDRAREVPSWSHKQIIENPDTFEQELRTIFSKPVIVEHKGNKTKIQFHENGKTIRSYNFCLGLWPDWLYCRKITKVYSSFFT